MKALESAVKIMEFIAVQVIPFADLIINSYRKWKKEKVNKNVNENLF